MAQRFQSLKYIYRDNCTVRKASAQKPSVDHFLLWFPSAALPFAKEKKRLSKGVDKLGRLMQLDEGKAVKLQHYMNGIGCAVP